MHHILKIFKQALRLEIRHEKGISLLIVVIIIGSALLIITASALVIGLGERQLGYIGARGDEAFSLADGCLSESTIRIRRNSSYGLGQGSIPLVFSNGSCSIQITDLGNNQRRIDSTATVAEFIKHIRSTVRIDPENVVSLSWEERPD